MKNFVLFIALIFVNIACQGQDKIYSTKAGAIKGYDPVAYFKESKPVPGEKNISYDWNGATWHFSSTDNLSLFKGDPEKYAPQYGGFCAYGVANGYTVKIEPEAWAIVDGKLYLNYNKDVQEEWNADRNGFIQKADSEWDNLLKKLEKE